MMGEVGGDLLEGGPGMDTFDCGADDDLTVDIEDGESVAACEGI